MAFKKRMFSVEMRVRHLDCIIYIPTRGFEAMAYNSYMEFLAYKYTI